MRDEKVRFSLEVGNSYDDQVRFAPVHLAPEAGNSHDEKVGFAPEGGNSLDNPVRFAPVRLAPLHLAPLDLAALHLAPQGGNSCDD